MTALTKDRITKSRTGEYVSHPVLANAKIYAGALVVVDASGWAKPGATATGLKAVGRGRLTARQIEAARRAMTRHIKRGGRIGIRIFPDKPISRQPAEVRMGNGKGAPEYYVAEIQPGKVLYEMDGVNETLAREAFRLAAAKLPIATTFVSRLIGR